MLKRVVLVLIFLSLVSLVSSVGAETGCIIVEKTVIDHGYSQPVDFNVDLKDSGGVVVDTLTFPASTSNAFLLIL